MHKLSSRDALLAGRLLAFLAFGALALVVVLECFTATAGAQPAERRADPAVRPEFREPVSLTSKEASSKFGSARGRVGPRSIR